MSNHVNLTLSKSDKYVITVNFCPRLELVQASQKIPLHAKVSPGGLLVSSINSGHINKSIHIPCILE